MRALRMAALVLTAFVASACAADTDLDEDEDVDTTDADESALSTAVRVETHFTDAKAPERDMAILGHVIRLIKDTPRGETIRIALHSLTANPVQAAIIDAKDRGVSVFVVHNGKDYESEDASPKALAKALGASHRWCGSAPRGGPSGGCISTHDSSLMHTKLALFSKTKDDAGQMREDVSWFGSANMTWATGAKSYNNTVTVYGDQKLYDRFVQKYYAKLWAREGQPRNDLFDGASSRGYITSKASGISVFASPDQDTDLVLRRLAPIQPGKGCEIRVAQAMIHDSRLAVVDRLADLKRDGCKVTVTGNHIQPKALAALKRAKIPIRINKTHDKLILIEAKYDGRRRKVVLTGSHNLTASANYVNDELLVKIVNPPVYASFVAHFDKQYEAGTPE